MPHREDDDQRGSERHAVRDTRVRPSGDDAPVNEFDAKEAAAGGTAEGTAGRRDRDLDEEKGRRGPRRRRRLR